MATDNLCHQQYQGLLPPDLMDIVAHHRLHFETDSATGNATGSATDSATVSATGSVFHWMGCPSEFGNLGLTSIGNSPAEAEQMYQTVIQVLDQNPQFRGGPPI